MNELATTERPAAMIDPASFKHVCEVAAMMVDSEMMPAHLQGRVQGGKLVEKYTREKRVATAFIICNAARLYEVDPFQFAQSTFVVHGKLDFDGRTYAALANSRGNLSRKLSYTYSGVGDSMRCVCSGTFAGESEPRTMETPTFAECVEQGGPAWKGCIPDQQLAYLAARNWVRRYCPEVLLGLVSERTAVDEPIAEPVTVESSVGEARLLEKPSNVAVHLEAVQNAASMDDLRAAKQLFESDETLTGMQRGEITQAGKNRQTLLGAIADCEAILHEHDDPAEIEKAWNHLESMDLPPGESKRLGGLFNERMKEFAEA